MIDSITNNNRTKQTTVFGGEGVFMATLKGPGLVVLQSLPVDRLVGAITSRSNPNAAALVASGHQNRQLAHQQGGASAVGPAGSGGFGSGLGGAVAGGLAAGVAAGVVSGAVSHMLGGHGHSSANDTPAAAAPAPEPPASEPEYQDSGYGGDESGGWGDGGGDYGDDGGDFGGDE